MDESRIFRYGAPGKLDTAPFGTECYVAQVNKPNEYEVYKQYSHNEEEPNWLFVEYIYDSEPKLINTYKIRDDLLDKVPAPIIANRNPTEQDIEEIETIWFNKYQNNYFKLEQSGWTPLNF